jgi:hypothetical protein
MDDLSPAFAAESLTANIINELRERLESTDNYTKQLGLITEMEEKQVAIIWRKKGYYYHILENLYTSSAVFWFYRRKPFCGLKIGLITV